MKKSLLILFIGITSFSFGQISHGFETWVKDSILLLDDYVSGSLDALPHGLNTTYPSTDAYVGQKSIKMEVMLTPDNDTIFGYFYIGDPGNGTPGQAVTLPAVDSIIGYYKSNIQAGDSATVLCETFDNGSSTGGGVFYLKGVQSTWKRFAFPIGAPTVDSMLLAIACGDPLNGFNGIPGSWIMIDNVFLKNGSTTANVDNYSFENWSTEYKEDPLNWQTSNMYLFGSVQPLPVLKTTDKHSGNYAIELNTLLHPQWGDTIGGYATNGILGNNGPEGGEPLVGNQFNIQLYYKYTPVGNDTAYVTFLFKSNGTPISYQGTSVYGNITSYTLWSNANVTLPSACDSVLIMIYSGENPGSKLLVDDVSIAAPVGENDLVNIFQVINYPNPVVDQVNFKFDLKVESKVLIKITDVTGKLIDTRDLGTLASGNYNEIFNTTTYSTGAYFVEFIVNETSIKNKIIVNK